MRGCYIDTSILGAYYCPEPLSESAEDFLQSVEIPAISLVTEVEFFSLIAKKKRMKDFGESKARKILMEFQSHLQERLYQKIIPLPDHYCKAMEMIGGFKTCLHALDAIHLAIAEKAGLPIATADLLLAKTARAFQIEAILLRP